MQNPRPVPLTILAIINLIGGVAGVGLLFLTPADSLTVEPFILKATGVTYGIICLAAFWGTWKAKSWGFWVLVGSLLFSILNSAVSLSSMSSLASELGASDQVIAKATTKLIGRSIVSLLIIAYLFRSEKVKAYFGRGRPS